MEKYFGKIDWDTDVSQHHICKESATQFAWREITDWELRAVIYKTYGELSLLVHCIVIIFLRMMTVFTDTSSPELTYSLNASSTYFIISDCNNPSFVGDGYCDDDTNNNDCEFDKGDCCGSLILTQYCHFCECIQYSTPSWTTTANISNFYQSCSN